MTSFQENQQGVQGFLKPRLGPCTSAKVSLPLHFTEWSKPWRQSKFKECGNRFFLSVGGDAQSECKGLEWKEWRMETFFPNVVTLGCCFWLFTYSPQVNPTHVMMSLYIVIIYPTHTPWCHHILSSIKFDLSSVRFKIMFLSFLLRDWKSPRQWHPTPVLLPGKSRGWRSLVGCSPWGC